MRMRSEFLELDSKSLYQLYPVTSYVKSMFSDDAAQFE